MRPFQKLALYAAGFLAPLAIATTAHAGIGACGNIHVEASAECEVQGGIECEASCEPIRLEAQCAADLTLECRGGCEGEIAIEAECTGSCEADCMGECEASPPTFDCRGQCFADCEGRASARCATGDNECIASAEGSCEAECSATCEVEPGTLDCEAECSGSCEASCTGSAEAYFDCQVECQRPRFEGCTAELRGGCMAECSTEEGALFCDGNYVDHGGNLAECVDSLRGLLNIMVSGSASCEGNSCMAEGSISCDCTAAEPQDNLRNGGLFALGGLFLFGFARRRRNR